MPAVYFTPNSAKLFQKIKDEKLKERIRSVLKKLAENSLLGKKLKGELSGQYTVRVWPYRIVYYIDYKKDVIITDIGHRKDVYR